MSLVAEYLEQFQSHYPAKQVEIKPKRERGEVRFRVLINGSDDGLLMTEDDLRFAVRMFKRGGTK